MMEEKKTIFNYISQAFATFGIIVLIFIVFGLIVGESARDYSPLFALGKEGISIPTLCELLLLSAMITFAQTVFMTDKWIMNMTIILRYIFMFVTVFVIMVIMIFLFKWFPLTDITSWIGFIVSYAISMFVSVLITRLRERAENSKMQEALDKYNRSKKGDRNVT